MDLMRAAAILLVLFGHCGWIYPQTGGILEQLMSLGGYLGVEVFFVLSGYLIGGILLRTVLGENFGWKQVRQFLRRRWLRTLPNYYLVLLVNIAIAAWMGYRVEGLWKYFFFLQNFAQPLLPFFPESWSLSVEEFAYVILPIGLMVAGRAVSTNKRIQFLGVVILLLLASLAAKVAYHINVSEPSLQYWNLALKSVVIYRLDAIFYGVAFAWLHHNFDMQWRRYRKALLFIGCCMLMFFTIGVGALGLFIERYPLFWNVLYLPLTSLGIACFLPALSLWQSTGKPLAIPITFISVISYSIYLLHYSVILQVLKHLVDTEALSPATRHVFTLGYLALTFFSSAMLFKFFEKPFMDLRDRNKASTAW